MREPSLPALIFTHWRPVLWPSIGLAACGSLYLWGASHIRGRWPLRRTLSFMAGLGCLLVALESGIGGYDDRLLSVHMVQHMLLLMVAPLLLLGGRPLILALRVLAPRRRVQLVAVLDRIRALTGPLQCLSAFAVVVAVTHLPWFYDAAVRHPALHEAEHALYLLAGLLLWWPILDSDPVPAHRLGGLARLGYLLGAMAPMALVGAYLNRHPTLVYAPYGPASRAVGVAPLADQAKAGAIMWVGGDMVMVVVGLWAVIAALVAEERRQQHREARNAALATRAGPGP